MAGSRAPHFYLRIHPAIVNDPLILIMNLVTVSHIADIAVPDQYIAFLMRCANETPLSFRYLFPDQLSVRQRNLDNHGRMSRPLQIEFVFCKKNDDNFRPIVILGINIPPLIRALPSGRTQSILASSGDKPYAQSIIIFFIARQKGRCRSIRISGAQSLIRFIVVLFHFFTLSI